MKPKAVSQLVRGRFSEQLVKEAAIALREKLGQNPTLGILFVSVDYIEHINDVLEIIRLNARVPLLTGCSTQGIIGTNEESEAQSGFSLLLLSLPDCQVKAVPFTQAMIEEATVADYWYEKTGLKPDDVKAWLVFADPFTCQLDDWLKSWNRAYPGVPCLGGLACGPTQSAESWLFLNDGLVEHGIAIALSGAIHIETVVSQGCKPIGEPLTVTHAEENYLLTIGSKPAFEVLNDVYQSLTDDERQKARGHLVAGLALNEYVEDFKQGDFIVRNILAADPSSGAVAINALPRVGQTMQYHLRDASAAAADLTALLDKAQKKKKFKPFAGILCNCNGRGRELFTVPNHDAHLINEHFPNLPLAGFFANGEVGPIGHQNFIHSFTASLALFSEI
ncbi:MAG: hypothetical protein B9S32_00030 [Verrucomicrobia bacterium Tous-C9LFEB]|nr:MAG: hypothetical protein B9S32_00030 [Verrucomicrobia bacterium Tous-C9LFEB]